jgi:hypothetical protein
MLIMSAYHIGELWETMVPFSYKDRDSGRWVRWTDGDKFVIKKVIINRFGRWADVLRPDQQIITIPDRLLVDNCMRLTDSED